MGTSKTKNSRAALKCRPSASGHDPADAPAHADPDFTFTNAYRVRWDAPKETAYPSTFVIDRQNAIRFAKISHTHGGRADVDSVVKELADLK